MAKRERVARAEDKNWVRPAHSGFEAPAYGVAVKEPVGQVFKDAYGNTRVTVQGGGSRIIKEA